MAVPPFETWRRRWRKKRRQLRDGGGEHCVPPYIIKSYLRTRDVVVASRKTCSVVFLKAPHPPPAYTAAFISRNLLTNKVGERGPFLYYLDQKPLPASWQRRRLIGRSDASPAPLEIA